MKKLSSKTKRIISKAVFHLLCGVSSALLAGVSFPAIGSPFALSFTGGVPPEYLITSCIGAGIGYMTSDALNALKNISSVTLLCFIRLGSVSIISEKRRKYVSVPAVLIASFLCSFTVKAISGINAADIILSFCEAVISAAASYFFSSSFKLFSGKEISRTPRADKVSAILCMGMILLSSSNVLPFSVSPLHIFSVLFLAILSYLGKSDTAPAAGIALAAAAGLGKADSGLIMSLSCAGLLAGICASYGKAASAVAVAAADLLSLILKGTSSPSVFICETFISLFIFLLLPKKLLFKLEEPLSVLCSESPGGTASRLISLKLLTAAKAMDDIASSVNSVNDILKNTDVPDENKIYLNVKEDMCELCPKQAYCWTSAVKSTLSSFKEANSTLVEKGRLTADDLPERLRNVCRSPESIAESFSRNMYEHNARLAARNDIYEAKQLAAAQYFRAGEVLREAAEYVEAENSHDRQTEQAAETVFGEFGFDTVQVSAVSDKYGKSTLTAYFDTVPEESDMTTITDRLYEKTGRCYLAPTCDSFSDSSASFFFREADVYDVYPASAVHTDSSERYCGDAHEYFFDGKGYFYVVIADGMGSGSRAALDSVMTSSLAVKLLKAGFSAECTFNSVNSALMLRSGKETLSTLDILKLRLSDGTAQIYKAGAYASFVMSEKGFSVIERNSMPLGILKEVRYEKSVIKLTDGDTLIMASDGITSLSYEKIRNIACENAEADPHSVACAIADAAKDAGPSGRNDDISVVAVRVCRG